MLNYRIVRAWNGYARYQSTGGYALCFGEGGGGGFRGPCTSVEKRKGAIGVKSRVEFVRWFLCRTDDDRQTKR